jgi:dienelactone hydrolase
MRRAVAVAAIAVLGLSACSHKDLVYEKALDDGQSFTAYLVSYQSSGLKVYAMVAVPKAAMPAGSYPVIIANHGHVPDPTKYGITADGVDSRPGDYYRSVPELYTSRGFLVVLADYRGHNNSEGLAFTERDNAVEFYADDVVALLAGLDEIKGADMNNVFMWSHSMGGGVSLRALLATDIIKGASFWATMPVGDTLARTGIPEVPIVLHHAVGDTSTASSNSQVFAEALEAGGQLPVFYSYDGADHYFEGATRERAADRDATFFRSLMSEQ